MEFNNKINSKGGDLNISVIALCLKCLVVKFCAHCVCNKRRHHGADVCTRNTCSTVFSASIFGITLTLDLLFLLFQNIILCERKL